MIVRSSGFGSSSSGVDLGLGAAIGPSRAHGQPAGVQRALPGQRDQLLDEGPHFLGLLDGGDDPLVLDQGHAPGCASAPAGAWRCGPACGRLSGVSWQ